MYRSTLIASCFIRWALEESKPITPVMVQKLIYFAHGFYLAFITKPLIFEVIYVGKHGPIIDPVYHNYKIFENHPIVLKDQSFSVLDEYDISHIKSVIAHVDWVFLESIWNIFKKYSEVELSSLGCASGSPWDITIQNNQGMISKNLPIDNELIRNHFTEEY
ncbi:MAG: type II toxin-antitoxin system antitoxin SocA domain-containing protein [Flavobacteriales bacterium]